MKVSLPPATSIVRFIMLWVGFIIGACVILSVVLLIIIGRLESLTTRTIKDLQAIETAHTLEMILLAEDHEVLRKKDPHDTHEDSSKNNMIISLQRAQTILNTMDIAATTREEEILIDKIEGLFLDFSHAAKSAASRAPDEVKQSSYDLLTALENYRELKNTQMKNSIELSRFLSNIIHNWLIILILVVITIIVIGSVALTKRIVQPTVELSRAAMRFGQGDSSARALVMYHDELGNLCRTFNTMADDIENRDKSRHQFIATIFHDIKNPLIIIGSTLRMLQKKIVSPDQLNIWLERIIKEVDRLENLTHDLMDDVQIETGRLSLHMSEIDLVELIADIHHEQAEVLNRYNLLFRSCDELRIRGDKRRLERVIINLLSNSAKYSPEGTTIIMKVERRDLHAVFSITDQGAGMSDEDVKSLFQPFGRLARTKHMAHGTGLGLFSVRKIIDAHGGSISVTSELGVGTTVEVSLPIAESIED